MIFQFPPVWRNEIAIFAKAHCTLRGILILEKQRNNQILGGIASVE